MNQLERKYLTAVEAAQYVGYTPNTLAQYRCRRIGPNYLKVRGRVLYAKEELDHWIKSYAEVTAMGAQTEG